jgi:hypothetical protein
MYMDIKKLLELLISKFKQINQTANEPTSPKKERAREDDPRRGEKKMLHMLLQLINLKTLLSKLM